MPSKRVMFEDSLVIGRLCCVPLNRRSAVKTLPTSLHPKGHTNFVSILKTRLASQPSACTLIGELEREAGHGANPAKPEYKHACGLEHGQDAAQRRSSSDLFYP